MNLRNQYPPLKKEIASIQNELLLLFLKYNLSFQYNLKETYDLSRQFQKKKSLFVHCILHAIFGNKTDKDPVIKMELAQSFDNQYWLEIASSGTAESFYCNVEEQCKDVYLKHYLKSADLKRLLAEFGEEPVEVSPAKDFEGSLIRIRLN